MRYIKLIVLSRYITSQACVSVALDTPCFQVGFIRYKKESCRDNPLQTLLFFLSTAERNGALCCLDVTWQLVWNILYLHGVCILCWVHTLWPLCSRSCVDSYWWPAGSSAHQSVVQLLCISAAIFHSSKPYLLLHQSIRWKKMQLVCRHCLSAFMLEEVGCHLFFTGVF